MLDSIYFALFTVIFVIGVVSLLYCVLLRVIKSRNDEVTFLVAVFDRNERNAVARVGSMLIRAKVSGERKHTKIVIVDAGMSVEQYKSLLRAYSSEPDVIFCTEKTLKNVFFM